MRLNKLTGLEQDKIIASPGMLEQIRDLSDILARAGKHDRSDRTSSNLSAIPSAMRGAARKSW